MAKFMVWVKSDGAYSGRAEYADTPEQARAAVQKALDEGVENHLSLAEMLLLGTEDFTIIGVQDYDEAMALDGAQVRELFDPDSEKLEYVQVK